MGQMGLSPTNFQKDMAACVKSATMLGAEHWTNGDQTRGTIGQPGSTDCFWITNLGALAMESGLRPATAQLKNRQRRFGGRLL